MNLVKAVKLTYLTYGYHNSPILPASWRGPGAVPVRGGPPLRRVEPAQGGWRPGKPILNRTKQLGIDLLEELDRLKGTGGQGNQS